MNLLQRIIRLPFVASSNVLQPFINTGLLAIGLMGVIKKNPQLQPLPAHEPLLKSNPFRAFQHFINIYKNLRDSSPDNEVIWLLRNGFLVTKNLLKMIFVDDTSNAVTHMPHMLAGKIETKHLIPNAGGHVYILAFSEGALASFGCVLLFFIRILAYATFVWILNKITRYSYKKMKGLFKRSEDNKSAIDVWSHDLSSGHVRADKKKPMYIKNYIKKRNAE